MQIKNVAGENKGLGGVLSLAGSEDLVSVVLIEGFSTKWGGVLREDAKNGCVAD